MTMMRKLKVFLCYASQDRHIVRELYSLLNSEAWIDPWLDQEKLLPGMDWELEIESAVRESDIVVVCLSHNSLNKKGYVQKEIRAALDIADQIPDDQIYIIPLRLEDCDVPLRLSKWQWVNYFEDKVYSYNLLLSALRSKIISNPNDLDERRRIAQLEGELSELRMELAFTYDATIEGWARALEIRDGDVSGHTFRVTELAVRFAIELGLDQEKIIDVRRGALLHDVGKMGVPDDVLLKSGPLTDTEWKVMREHPQLAYDMLSPIKYLRKALEIPYCHHEHWDGSGFPRGLKGKEIPLSARIFALVDVWDSLRSDRSYRRAWTEDKVLAYIKELSGTIFDPELVPLFIKLIEKMD